MIEPAAGSGSLLRAQLRLGATTLARHQLTLLLALECQTIVCIAVAFDEHVAALQAATRGAGCVFHRIAGPRALLGLVTATDEVIALGDGLLAVPRSATALLGTAAVLVQPVETGLAAGFERLDLNHADAGAIRMPGRLVARLAELPEDCDGFSALQRIALQGGVPQKLVPGATLAEGRWQLVRSEADAQRAEGQWLWLQTESTGTDRGSQTLAQLAVRRAGPALLHAGSGNRVVAAAAGLTGLLALLAGHLAWAVPAFVLAALTWILLCAAALLARVEGETLHLPRPRYLRGSVFGWIMDGLLAVLMIACTPAPPDGNIAARAFAPVMLLGLCRLVPGRSAQSWTQWLHDRGLLALVLAALSMAGVLEMGIELFAVLLLIADLYDLQVQTATKL